MPIVYAFTRDKEKGGLPLDMEPIKQRLGTNYAGHTRCGHSRPMVYYIHTQEELTPEEFDDVSEIIADFLEGDV